MTDALKPPRADRRPVSDTRHGITRVDEYAWLRADNWQEVMREPEKLPADIRAYLEAENAYTEARMAPTKALQETLFAEMKGRIKEDDSSVPSPDGPYAYSMDYITGGQFPRFCRSPRDLSSPPQVLLDGNALAAGLEFFRFGNIAHSPDHRRIGWAADDNGSELFTIRVRDAQTGADLADAIGHTTGDLVWAADSASFFYVEQDENHRPCRVWLHRLGTARDTDKLIYEEPDAGFFVSIAKTQSEAYVLISAHDHETTEMQFIPAAAPETPPHLIAAREHGVQYDVEHWGDAFFIETNRDGAEDFKIATAPLASPEPAHWRDVIAHQPGHLIISVGVFARHMVRMERVNGLPRIVVRELASGEEHIIAQDEEAYSLGLGEALEFDTDMLRFSYSSPTTPSQVFDYNMVTRERVLRKRQEVPSGHDASAYVTRRVQAPAADGQTVPVTLLYRKDTKLDGSAPLWLYGYGAYGISIPSSFSTSALSLVDRGFVYAIAHIRGGKDKGYRWYTDGKLGTKMNSFTDFLAAADHLVALGFTSRGRIVAQGGSAGGLLMGAVANMDDGRFGAVVAEVPFVDCLTTMLDDTLPLTPPEWHEWGNPIESAEDYATIAAYSPYDNVAPKPYPALLALAGLTDPRVTYWEPAKWVARLRAVKTDEKPLLLKTHMGAGHGGSPGRFDRLRETALSYAFGIEVMGGGL
ncbi:MAG: S9 family peptidase [Aestuariivirgaceae bacterium]|nr:S9 family peptidase [Aestuariivirgaceae bacterium]